MNQFGKETLMHVEEAIDTLFHVISYGRSLKAEFGFIL